MIRKRKMTDRHDRDAASRGMGAVEFGGSKNRQNQRTVLYDRRWGMTMDSKALLA